VPRETRRNSNWSGAPTMDGNSKHIARAFLASPKFLSRRRQRPPSRPENKVSKWPHPRRPPSRALCAPSTCCCRHAWEHLTKRSLKSLLARHFSTSNLLDGTSDRKCNFHVRSQHRQQLPRSSGPAEDEDFSHHMPPSVVEVTLQSLIAHRRASPAVVEELLAPGPPGQGSAATRTIAERRRPLHE